MYSKTISVIPLDGNSASCGSFAWLGTKPFNSGQLIYEDVEIDHRRAITMRLNGKPVHFSMKSPLEPRKYFGKKVGETFEEVLTSKEFETVAKWTVTKIFRDPRDEAAGSVFFDVEFSLTEIGHQNKTKIRAQGYSGC